MSIFSCNDEISRECGNCPDYEPNRIIHMALVKKGVLPSLSLRTVEERLSDFLQAELECNAIIFRNINGVKPDPTASEQAGRGRQTAVVGNYTHTIDVQDHDYVSNQEKGFYNALLKNSILYDLYYFTETKVWEVRNANLMIKPLDPITDDNSTNIIGKINISWRQEGLPIPYPFNTYPLDVCPTIDNVYVFSTGGCEETPYLLEKNELDFFICQGTLPATIYFNNGDVENQTSVYTITIIEGTLPTNHHIDEGKYIVREPIISGLPNSSYIVVRISNKCGSVIRDIRVNLNLD